MTHGISFSKTALRLLRFSRRLWVRVLLMAMLAVAAAGAAPFLALIIPQEISERFTPEAVLPILTILASGMLAVSTFSLNVMVSAYRAAASQATPRAHRILLADTTTQTVLATFIGSFVYSLSAIILFKAKLIAPGTSVTMLGVTVVVLILLVITMLRWINHLSELGSMDSTLRTTVAETRPCLLASRTRPALGGTPLTDDTVLPADARPLPAPVSGYLQFVDMPSLDAAAGGDGAVYLTVLPGDFLLEGQVIGHVAGCGDADISSLTAHLIIGDTRTFEQDAAYGLLVLAEIASRALSPGLNDPGTAIDVIARQQSLLWDWAGTARSSSGPAHPRIFLREVTAETLIANAFGTTARDGASLIEVANRLLFALETLADGPDADLAEAAIKMADHARDHANVALVLESDRNRLHHRPAR